MPVYELLVNGKRRRVKAEADTPLLWVLRDQLRLTGTKFGCGEGACGACTVLLGGLAVRSCTVTVSEAGKKPVTTIEGLAAGDKLHPVQQAFLDASAYQCGYCTPGMILAAAALLDEMPAPSAEETSQRLEDHICRCGTYPRIVDAVRLAASRMTSKGAGQ